MDSELARTLEIALVTRPNEPVGVPVALVSELELISVNGASPLTRLEELERALGTLEPLEKLEKLEISGVSVALVSEELIPEEAIVDTTFPLDPLLKLPVLLLLKNGTVVSVELLDSLEETIVLEDSMEEMTLAVPVSIELNNDEVEAEAKVDEADGDGEDVITGSKVELPST